MLDELDFYIEVNCLKQIIQASYFTIIQELSFSFEMNDILENLHWCNILLIVHMVLNQLVFSKISCLKFEIERGFF
jgi:ABC-type iron transport system FetAB permease component